MNSGLLSKGSGNGERGEGGKTGRKVVGVRKSERERASGREQGGASKGERARGSMQEGKKTSVLWTYTAAKLTLSLTLKRTLIPNAKTHLS